METPIAGSKPTCSKMVFSSSQQIDENSAAESNPPPGTSPAEPAKALLYFPAPQPCLQEVAGMFGFCFFLPFPLATIETAPQQKNQLSPPLCRGNNGRGLHRETPNFAPEVKHQSKYSSSWSPLWFSSGLGRTVSDQLCTHSDHFCREGHTEEITFLGLTVFVSITNGACFLPQSWKCSRQGWKGLQAT